MHWTRFTEKDKLREKEQSFYFYTRPVGESVGNRDSKTPRHTKVLLFSWGFVFGLIFVFLTVVMESFYSRLEMTDLWSGTSKLSSKLGDFPFTIRIRTRVSPLHRSESVCHTCTVPTRSGNHQQEVSGTIIGSRNLVKVQVRR